MIAIDGLIKQWPDMHLLCQVYMHRAFMLYLGLGMYMSTHTVHEYKRKIVIHMPCGASTILLLKKKAVCVSLEKVK